MRQLHDVCARTTAEEPLTVDEVVGLPRSTTGKRERELPAEKRQLAQLWAPQELLFHNNSTGVGDLPEQPKFRPDVITERGVAVLMIAGNVQQGCCIRCEGMRTLELERTYLNNEEVQIGGLRADFRQWDADIAGGHRPVTGGAKAVCCQLNTRGLAIRAGNGQDGASAAGEPEFEFSNHSALDGICETAVRTERANARTDHDKIRGLGPSIGFPTELDANAQLGKGTCTTMQNIRRGRIQYRDFGSEGSCESCSGKATDAKTENQDLFASVISHCSADTSLL
jgi:hypothetical protein